MEKSFEGIAYLRHGSGPPMLVMHGPIGLDHSFLRPWLDPLGDQVELVYYDHRGNGASDAPTDWSSVDLATWADDADALRERLGYGRVVVFGHSLGGGVALEYALRHPERVRGLVLCGAASNFQHMERVLEIASARGTAEQLQALQTGLSAPVPDDESLRRLWKTVLPLYFHAARPDVARSILEKTPFRARAFNRAMLECLPAFDVQPRLTDIAAPALLLTGADDWICPPDPCLDRLAAIPRARKVLFEKSGHMPFIEEPDRFTEVVRDWLSELA